MAEFKYRPRRWLRFSIRDVFWLFSFGMVLALFFMRGPLPPPPPRHPPPGPPSAVGPSAVGRYQMAADPKSGYLFLLDTATGHMWKLNSNQWEDYKSPAEGP
jgi:hypothetical protein